MYIKLLVICIGISVVSCRRHVHFYRKDYTFFEEYDAYYKMHWDTAGLSWNAAFMACDDEGAKLFYPKEDNEWNVVKNLTENLPVAPNVTDIYVGIHDEFGLGEFITIDGQATSEVLSTGLHCMVMEIETGLYKPDSCYATPETIRPFVCKKVDDKPCPTIDQGYIYQQEAKKCYKINKRQKTWQEALHNCFMEGGMLAVPQNDLESKIIEKMMPGNVLHFIGFRKMFSDNDFYTVRGQKLEESGYNSWYGTQNESDGECGAAYGYNSNLYYKSDNCHTPLHYICEMNATV